MQTATTAIGYFTMLCRSNIATLVSFLYFSSVLAKQPQKEKRYYVNQADIGGSTVLPAYLTTGTNDWDKATLTSIDWQTWGNSWATTADAASTLSTALTEPTTIPETTSIPTSTSSTPTANPSTTSTSSKTSDLSSTSTRTTSTSTSSSSVAALQEKSQHSKEDEDKKSRHAKIVIGVVCGIVGMIALFAGLLLLYCFLQQRKKKNTDSEANDNDNEKQITSSEPAAADGYHNGLFNEKDGNSRGLAAAGAAVGGGAVMLAAANNRHSVHSINSGSDTRSHFDTKEKELERIESPISDNASTITGSFASLSEKLKEIHQQYSIRDIDDVDGEYDNGSVNPGNLHSMSSFSTLNDASSSSISGPGNHAAGFGAGAGAGAAMIAIGNSTAESVRSNRSVHADPFMDPPSINNRSIADLSESPKGTPATNMASPAAAIAVAAGAAAIAGAARSTDKKENCESSSSDDDLYVDRKKLIKSQNSNSTDQLHLQEGDDNNVNVNDNHQIQDHLEVANDRNLKNNSPDTVTTGTTVLSEIASDDASFEQDANFPNKYNNFATELLTVKSGKKPRLIHIESSHKNNNNGNTGNSQEKTTSPAGLVEQNVVSKSDAAAAKQGTLEETKRDEENERKESIGTLETVKEQGVSEENASDYQSTSSKRRVSQFDFESDDNKDVEEYSKERKLSDGSYFTEKI